MQTTNLKELRELRTQEKAIKARIDEISTEATNEAVAILAEQNLVKARTAIMNGYVKTFVELYPDKEPDEIKLTVKVIN